MKTWHTIKGFVAGGIAFIACPCHLPVTLPLLVVLTAGTALSTWLKANALVVSAISTVVFAGGLFLAYKWIGETKPAGPTRSTVPNETHLIVAAPCPACEERASLQDQGARAIRETIH